MICPAASEKMLPLQLDGFPFYLYFEFFFGLAVPQVEFI